MKREKDILQTGVIIHENGEVLVGKLAEGAQYAGFWEFPLADTVRQTMGVEVTKNEAPYDEVIYETDRKTIVKTNYLATIRSGTPKNDATYDAVRWIPVDVLRDVEWTPVDEGTVTKLLIDGLGF
ncbi:MAG: hypothetical protein LBM95_01125 [Lactobacillales bacterium]|jgi:8-oxo-dGTP diphosphatase|nr:hypothetical protein [Lactobacillales bacterium]